MGQILHKRATTTHAIRAELQRSSSSIRELAKRSHINPKTVLKRRHRQGVEDAPLGAKCVSSVLSQEEQEVICAFRQKTLLPLDDCYVSLKDIIPSFQNKPKRKRINKTYKLSIDDLLLRSQVPTRDQRCVKSIDSAPHDISNNPSNFIPQVHQKDKGLPLL